MQRDYFGAHTFRVLPGKENAKLKAGEDIRESNTPPTKLVRAGLTFSSNLTDINWTGRGGSVSASTYSA